jgi:hypothetical protein
VENMSEIKCHRKIKNYIKLNRGINLMYVIIRKCTVHLFCVGKVAFKIHELTKSFWNSQITNEKEIHTQQTTKSKQVLFKYIKETLSKYKIITPYYFLIVFQDVSIFLKNII